MISRSLPPLYDPCTCLHSYLLLRTLEDFLPPLLESPPYLHHSGRLRMAMPFAHHLVYFPPALPLPSLHPDGTDPLHSPGQPFTRRMWAGGEINYSQLHLSQNQGPAFCQERITDLNIRGREGEEKAYVRIERHIDHFPCPDEEHKDSKAVFGVKKEILRRYFDTAVARGPCEVLNLVFLRDDFKHVAQKRTDVPPKAFKVSGVPDFSHTLVPSASLLFRFSALTFNAHAIHLDKHYCQEIEGHRNLLVHGPLIAILMTELLRRYLENMCVRSGKPPNAKTIESIEYRNLAPLYAEEQMTISGRRRKGGEWDIVVQGTHGGLAVRGLARIRSPKPNSEP